MLNLKTLSLPLILLLLSGTLNAQETKTVSVKRKNDYFTISEKYAVMKSEPMVKHGPYAASLSNYSEKGQFEQGVKTGVWETFDDGKLIQKYDFKTQSFLQDDAHKLIKSATQINDQGNPVKELGSTGVYLGGDAKILSILVRSVRYPGDAQQNNVQGYVVIEAKLDKAGKLTDARAISTNGHGLEEEGLRLFNLLPPDWLPVLVDGKPVDVRFQVRVSFRLSHLPPLKAD